MIKLDFNLKTPEERIALVNKILEENPSPNSQYLEVLANYIVYCMESPEKKEKKILTDNRLATVNKRETSYEGLVAQFENGEDGIYNLVDDNKHTILDPKDRITKRDLREIPELQQTTESIAYWDNKVKTSTGKDAYIAKKALIETRKDQYVIKNAFRQPVQASFTVHSVHNINLDDSVAVDEDGNCVPSGVSLLNPKICSTILCNYSKLIENSWGRFDSDTFYLMIEFDRISELALTPYPMYYRLVQCKIDGMQNAQIRDVLLEEFGIEHSLEYISSLWRNKIPQIIASKAEDLYLDWYYLEVEKGKYKRCSKCGKIKLATNKYFSKNKTSRDGWYSMCKECRNSKGVEK